MSSVSLVVHIKCGKTKTLKDVVSAFLPPRVLAIDLPKAIWSTCQRAWTFENEKQHSWIIVQKMKLGLTPTPCYKNLVLVGGGHAHVHVLKMWGMQPLPGVQLTLITRDLSTPYSGMLPGFIAGHYSEDDCHIDLTRLANFAGARLVHSEACGLDLFQRHILCRDGRPPLPYDILSLDIGSSPSTSLLNDPFDASTMGITPVKPIDGLSARWNVLLERVRQWPAEGPPLRLLVVGGGAAGVELALAMQFRLGQEMDGGGERVKVSLLTKGTTVLPSHPAKAQEIFIRIFKKRGIDLHTQAEAVTVKEDPSSPSSQPSSTPAPFARLNVLHSKDGRSFPYHECVWCTEGQAAPWLMKTGLTLDEKGFLAVNRHLQSVSDPYVFAAGDVSSMLENPRPKAGVFAVRAGPPLLRNLQNALRGATLTTYTPQSTFLSLISTGDKYAIASKGSVFVLEGAWLWKMKDHIDRKFMRMYQDLPSMDPSTSSSSPPFSLSALSSFFTLSHPPNPSDPGSSPGEAATSVHSHTMRCGGCGSKVGASILSRVLSRIKQSHSCNEDILLGMGDDAAVFRPPPPPLLQIQTLDFFRIFFPRFDPYVFGQIAANHALSDCHAMNARPRTALAQAVVPLAASEKLTEGLLLQLLAGAVQVLNAAGCTLVGGHTSEGTELTLGFAITGEAHPSQLLYKKGILRNSSHLKNDEEESEDVKRRRLDGMTRMSPGRSLSRASSPSTSFAPVPTFSLLLTKALGTGTIMAAAGQGQGSAKWEAGAVASMLQSNAKAADILWREGGAIAATDVTGFGVLGHLTEMIRGDNGMVGEDNLLTTAGTGQEGGVRARLILSSLPALPGAEDCLAKGITSSLAPANQHHARHLLRNVSTVAHSNTSSLRQHSKYPLLFDPQTAGGLLACVPVDKVGITLHALQAAGYEAACVIGEVWNDEKTDVHIELVID